MMMCVLPVLSEYLSLIQMMTVKYNVSKQQ